MVQFDLVRKVGRNPIATNRGNSRINIHAPRDSQWLGPNMTRPVKPIHLNTTTIVQYPKDSHMAGGVPPLDSVAVCQQPECMMQRKRLL